MSKGKIRTHQAPPERGHHRPRRPRQDHADRGPDQGAVRQVRRRVQGLRPDRQRPGRAGARHHHRDQPRRVRNRQPPLRPCRLPGPCRLRQEHDHRRRPDGRRRPGGRRGRRPRCPRPARHPAGPPGRRAVHHRLPQQGRHGGRQGAAGTGRDGGADLLTKYDFPGDKTPIITGSALKALEGDQSEIGEPSILRLAEAIDTYIPAAEARHRRAVPDAGRRRVLHLGPRHRGHRPHRARHRQGRR